MLPFAAVQWLIVIAALIYALLFAYFDWGGASAYVLAALPVLLTVMLAGTWLAGAVMALLPMYFVIGQATAGWHHYQPYLALDRVTHERDVARSLIHPSRRHLRGIDGGAS